MEIGLGLVVATLIAIAAWQIDKRQAWRRAGKWLIWTVGVTGVIATLVIAAYFYSEARRERANQALLAESNEQLATRAAQTALEIREGSFVELGGLKLEMTEDEVRYRVGDSYMLVEDGWAERSNSSRRKFGAYDNQKRLQLIGCMGGFIPPAIGCSQIGAIFAEGGNSGLPNVWTEGDLIALLGQPNCPIDPVKYDDGHKVFCYGVGGKAMMKFYYKAEFLETVTLTARRM